MMPAEALQRAFFDQLGKALLWVAAFCYAVTIFLVVSNDVKLPPTAPVAIGRVTIDHVSKSADYVTAAIYYALVPILSLALFLLFGKALRRLATHRTGQRPRSDPFVSTLLFTLPFILAPMFYLTTRKEVWGVLLPPLLAVATVYSLIKAGNTAWIRAMFTPALRAIHLLLFMEALCWILFRYLGTGLRIAHIPTLFLEVVFVGFFIFVFWSAALLISKMTALLRGEQLNAVLPRFAAGALPLLILPFLGLFIVSAHQVILIVASVTIVSIVISLSGKVIPSLPVRRVLAWGFIPLLLFALNFGSTYAPSSWTDLFHRGEALGPASDYLRGKVPYRDVFVLHGLLDDGFLDAFLMKQFGRNVEVMLARLAVVDSLGIVAVWILGMVLFDSIPLAAVTVLLAMVTTAGAQRGLFEILTVIFLIVALRKRQLRLLLISGIMAGLALFYSLDIGVYSLTGGVLALLTLAFVRRRARQPAYLPLAPALLTFLSGAVLAGVPFCFYLASNHALRAFFRISFIEIPTFIDAVWSLPYPELTRPFRNDLSLRTLFDFILGEPVRFVLNPLVVGVALTCIVARAWRRHWSEADPLLIILTLFSLMTQRSALGRADFPHQYFSAFLVAPLLVILLVLLFRRLRPMWSEGTDATRALVTLIIITMAPLLYVSLWVPDLLNAKLEAFIRYRPRITGIGYTEPLLDEVAPRVELLRNEIHARTSANSPIFDFSNQPALYFFCDRPNPTRFYQVPVISPLRYQREAIEVLQKSAPKIVIRRSPSGYDLFDGIPNELRAPALASYLDDHYRYATTVRGVELWQRSSRPLVRPMAWYLRHQRIPSQQMVREGRKTRLFFPSVGSLAGVGGAFWRSDLIVHNPSAKPLQLTLRYMAARPVERRLVVPPGKNMQFQDVVQALFSSPGTRGALMIEFTGDRAPLARVRTFDAARGATGIAESPLSIGDAADAKSPAKRLTLVGIPGDGSRRVTLGVVGIGAEPAAFRIWATTSDGAVVGLPVEGAAEEQGIFVLPEANVRLGVPITPDIVLHIGLTRGTALAYASVVDVDSGNTQLIAAVPTE